MQTSALLSRANLVLKEFWGYETFRPDQIPPVLSLGSGQDTLAIMPTGSGKSICYQVSGLLRGGLCLVVSPLIALMSDQVNALKAKGIAAEFISSESNSHDLDRILNNAIFGGVKFLYLAPERLKNPLFLARIGQMDIRTIAIDEAHCISQWGHDFRPAFREISALRPLCHSAAWGAFTATATEEVAHDIGRQLFMSPVVEHRSPIRRNNLMFGVYTIGDSHRMLLETARRMRGSGLIYVGTRHESHQIAERLKQFGVNAESYHAGLKSKEKRDRQSQWMDGQIQVLTCTSAFGMGIDKNNVRWVFHAHVPQNLESYLQEAGRAGRDGFPATCILFPSIHASKVTEKNLNDSFPSLALIQSVYQGLANQGRVAIGDTPNQPTSFQLDVWAKQHNFTQRQTESSLQILQKEGYIEWRAEASTSGKRFEISPSLRLGLRQLAEESAESCLGHWLIRQTNEQQGEFVFQTDRMMKATRLSLTEVTDAFEKLVSYGWIQRKEKAKNLTILWKTARIDSKVLIVTKDSMEVLKSSALQKWNAVSHYLTSESCRATTIEHYFGEQQTQPCGACDNCRASEQPQVLPEIESFPKQGISVTEWLWKFPLIRHNQQINTLYRLRDANLIRIKGDLILPNISD